MGNSLHAIAEAFQQAFSRMRTCGAYRMSTILMTEALPMRCSATMESPFAQYRMRFACSIAAARISSVVSVSVALQQSQPIGRRADEGGRVWGLACCSDKAEARGGAGA